MNPILAVGDAVWLSLIALVGTVIGPFVVWKLQQISKDTRATHVLVNNKTAVALKRELFNLKRIAILEPSQDNDEAVVLAQKELDEHMAQQAIVDKQDGKAVATNHP